MEQEARIIALRVLNSYDPHHPGGATIDTLLADALRRAFKRLVKHTPASAEIYTVEQQTNLRAELRATQNVDPLRGIEAARVLARIARLPKPQQTLVRLLIAANGSVRRVAEIQRWPLAQTYRRVKRLRATLQEPS